MTKLCDECETVAHCSKHGCIPKRDFWKDYEPEPTVTKGYSFADLNPKYAGGYWVGELQINIKEKPIWLHRTMMRLCFGWKWKDAK